jgi:predicted RNA methylase
MTNGITKSGGRKHNLDKFYTKPEIAHYCIQQLGSLDEYTHIIEPGAGNGSFSNQIPNAIAFDINPEHESIIRQDWFQYHRKRKRDEKVLVIGNPPFGQQNTLALDFINHAAHFADTIAFILPLTFMKESLHNRIHESFHLETTHLLPPYSFTLDGEERNVPCVFQVWRFSSQLRAKLPKLLPYGFKFVRKELEPDFYIQRVGSKAGEVGEHYDHRNPHTTFFIKVFPPTTKEELIEQFKLLSFPDSIYNVGPRSISKREILKGLRQLESPYVIDRPAKHGYTKT